MQLGTQEQYFSSNSSKDVQMLSKQDRADDAVRFAFNRINFWNEQFFGPWVHIFERFQKNLITFLRFFKKWFVDIKSNQGDGKPWSVANDNRNKLKLKKSFPTKLKSVIFKYIIYCYLAKSTSTNKMLKLRKSEAISQLFTPSSESFRRT